MAYVNYTATRKIIGGHSPSVAYDIDFDASSIDRSTKVNNKSNFALNGNRETLLWNQDVIWNVTATFILQANLPLWREFLASVSAGETFTFDPYGTAASPSSDVISGTLESTSSSEQRLGNTVSHYDIGFKVRVNP